MWLKHRTLIRVKKRFDRHCRERNLLFDVGIDYSNVHALSALLKSKKKQYLIDLP